VRWLRPHRTSVAGVRIFAQRTGVKARARTIDIAVQWQGNGCLIAGVGHTGKTIARAPQVDGPAPSRPQIESAILASNYSPPFRYLWAGGPTPSCMALDCGSFEDVVDDPAMKCVRARRIWLSQNDLALRQEQDQHAEAPGMQLTRWAQLPSTGTPLEMMGPV
jgi:hypothetical protein